MRTTHGHRGGVRRGGPRRAQRGGALVEYTLVVLLLVLVLVVDPNVIGQLAQALREAYASFVYALSASWI